MRAAGREAKEIEIHELEAHDVVGLARCITLDVDVFPHPSLPLGMPPGQQTLVAASGDPRRVVGFVTSVARAGTRYVGGLAVAPAARRRGVGRALVRECIARARRAGIRWLVLHVGVANRPAVALYDAEGFDLRLVLRDFYRPGLYESRDAYELALRITRR